MSQCYKRAFGGLVKTVGWTKHNIITLDALGNGPFSHCAAVLAYCSFAHILRAKLTVCWR